MQSAIMCVADLFQVYGSELMPLADIGGSAKPTTSLLAQLLLKASSNDKRFVIEEVLRALTIMTDSVAPVPLLDHVLPYTAHRAAKVRGRAALVLAAGVARLDAAALAAYGTAGLVKAAGMLVSDNTPEAREAARQMLPRLHDAFAVSGGAQPEAMHLDPVGGKENRAEPTLRSNSSPQLESAAEAPVKSEWERFVFRTVLAVIG